MKTCHRCKKELTGIQTTYCGNECRRAGQRRMHGRQKSFVEQVREKNLKTDCPPIPPKD